MRQEHGSQPAAATRSAATTARHLPPSRAWLDVAFLALFAGSVFFTQLGSAKLWDRDEPRNAGCAAEMLARGDWVTPMFNDELRGQKPVLTYWLMMSAMSVWGTTEFAARFWSAALGVGTVLLTYAWARHLLCAAWGRWAAMVLSTTLMFTLASRAATPDAPLIFFSTLSITLYVLLTFRASSAVDWEEVLSSDTSTRLRVPGRWFPRWHGALLIYAAMALGVLAKGPVAVVLPTLIIGLFILIERSRPMFVEAQGRSKQPAAQNWGGLLKRWIDRGLSVAHPGRFVQAVLLMQPWWLVAMVALIALPWFVWVGLRTDGEFLQLFFFREHLERATTAMEGHRGGWWFYPLAIVVGVFPWSIFVVPSLLTLWRCGGACAGSDPQREGAAIASASASRDVATSTAGESPRHWPAALTLALVWVGLQVVVFSLASTKLPSYVTPCYSAVAVLLAVVPWRLSQGRLNLRPLWLRAGWLTWLMVGIAVSAALWLFVTREMGWPVGWLPAIGAVLVVGSLVAAYCYERQRPQQVGQTLVATSWLFTVLIFGFATAYVSQFRQTDDLWEIARSRQPETGRLAGYRDLESTWVYYAGQPIWELDADAAQPVDNVGSPVAVDRLQRQHDWEVKPRASVAEFLEHYPGSCIVTPAQHLPELLGKLPPGYGPLATRPDFLTANQLVLVGPLDAPEAPGLPIMAERPDATGSTPR